MSSPASHPVPPGTLPPFTAAGPATPVPPGVLVSLSLAMLLSSLSTSIANVALPALVQAFAAPFEAVQWVVVAYLMTITLVIVGVGRLGDVAGRRRLLLIGLTLFTLASMACGLATGLGPLIAARVLQGLGAAVMMALSLALVNEVVPKDRAGRTMGLLGTLSAVGTAMGPTLGGWLIGAWGWQAIFWVQVPLSLVALAMAFRHLPADAPSAAPKAARTGHAGAVLQALRQPLMASGFATSALATTVVMATLVVGPFFLAGAFGLDAARMGLVMSVGPAVAALVAAPAGRLVDRLGARRVNLGGLFLMGLGSAALPFAAAVWGVAGYAGALALITAGYATVQTANNTAVMAQATANERGLVSGLLQLSRNLGLITGASVMGAVFQFGASDALGPTADAPALAAGLRLTFLLAAALVALAAGLSLWAARRKEV
ncbi:MFS transporter [Hydrogenophaga sp.]|uniref:MFS transporter n=1 Tax=Hydrogenophaga sp. TaxID=1904254 RepID=UPI00272FC6FF|nr:MFS transporter [Hydrogenophaga sp.]MDP1684344.1 MFS transporter [Hydrogenophaga sp.]